MSDKTALGDRIKGYETLQETQLLPMVPAIARLDGRAFHTFTRGLKRPYDKRLTDLMVATTNALVRKSNANIGYTQSDEITLVWMVENIKSEMFFGGRVQKMVSTLAAEASVYFNTMLPEYIPEKAGLFPTFDCRVFNVPNKTEAANTLVWREMDATRNSISMAAQSMFSHKQLMGKSCSDMQDMLMERGVNWNDYPPFFKRGTYVQRTKTSRPFTEDELKDLPPKHEARKNPDLMIVRTDYKVLDMPPITKVCNREQVIFEGKAPLKLPTVAVVIERNQ